MDAMSRKGVRRKKAASGMGLNMIVAEDRNAEHMLTRLQAAVHKAYSAPARVPSSEKGDGDVSDVRFSQSFRRFFR